VNPGAQANIEKAKKVGAKIAVWRSEGRSYKEIGELLDMSESAAKQRLWRYKRHQGGCDA
jgi:DNA-binding CsgD family transcriptional regulator